LSKSYLSTDIAFAKGVGPAKAEVLGKELEIRNYRDLVFYLPYRYVDRTEVQQVASLRHTTDPTQVIGVFTELKMSGPPKRQRLVGKFKDSSGVVEVIWFQGAKWIKDKIKLNTPYLLFGKPQRFGRKINIAHPELKVYDAKKGIEQVQKLMPLYNTTELMKKKGLDSKNLAKIMAEVIKGMRPSSVVENLPGYILRKSKLPNRYDALVQVHQPNNFKEADSGKNRLKFEELFYYQLSIISKRNNRKAIKGWKCSQVGERFNAYYKEYIPFELTGAQKRVIKEIRRDLGSGVQMNRLLQGDVGSGKTMVAIMSMLIALDNGLQSALMAPTEILAQQHYNSIKPMLAPLGIKVAILTGSIKTAARRALFRALQDGYIHILIGTHALIEPKVKFHRLGLVIIDEQHRFGVAQRARLQTKNPDLPPHVLVMSATPIPRTLAMTTYGELDVSVIDELPPGRKPIETVHKFEKSRLWILGFIKKQIGLGRQVYVVYPLIDESEKLDLANLMEGFHGLEREFPPPQYHISVVHGKMKPEEKDYEMQRFAEGKTHIMVATTVIEVGVNVPNASVMVIENAERFGLAQLHQLRGRVGRGAEQSYCILATGYKLSENGKKRIQTLCESNDGFRMAEVDLELRGGGDLDGTQQSGVPELVFSNLMRDAPILNMARTMADIILNDDPELVKDFNSVLRYFFERSKSQIIDWRRIS